MGANSEERPAAAYNGDDMPADSAASKHRFKTLLLEGVNDSAAELFLNWQHLSVERIPKALEEGPLREAIKGIDLLGIRSRTQLTRDVFSDAGRLMAVGCFSVGTN